MSLRGLIGILVAGLVLGAPALAFAACLPGQTCWQPSQPSVQQLQQRVINDRAQVIQNQQQVISDRAKVQIPFGNPTPLDKIQQRQNLLHSEDQLRQSQQSLQQSQQQLQEQNRPPLSKPYVIGPDPTKR